MWISTDLCNFFHALIRTPQIHKRDEVVSDAPSWAKSHLIIVHKITTVKTCPVKPSKEQDKVDYRAGYSKPMQQFPAKPFVLSEALKIVPTSTMKLITM